VAAQQLRSFVGSALEITAASFDLANLVNTDPAKVQLAQFESRLRERLDEQALKVYGITIRQVGIERVLAEVLPEDKVTAIRALQDEGRVVEERHGVGAPAHLARLGVFDGRVLAAHCVWLDEEEMDVMAAHDVAVAHCPGSNGKLGAGVAKLTRMLAHGLRVGLGTDGPASNDDLHLWDEMRLAAILARASATDPGALGSAEALRLATRGGAGMTPRSNP